MEPAMRQAGFPIEQETIRKQSVVNRGMRLPQDKSKALSDLT